MIPQKTKEFFMGTQKNYDLAKCLSFFTSLLILGGCASTMSQYDLSTCLKRGGKVENRCTVMSRDSMGRNTGCQMSQDVCVGGISHEAYEKQQQLSQELKSRPRPALSPEQKAARKLERWEKRLDSFATEKWLTRNAHKYPKLTWLSSRWCLKGSDSKIPANYYNVEQTQVGSLNIHYGDIDVLSKHYTHVAINGNYYDLWDGSGYSTYLRDERGRRLEKISDEEFALVYKFKGKRLPGRTSWTEKKMSEFAVREGQKVGPEQHIKNPEIYVKCE